MRRSPKATSERATLLLARQTRVLLLIMIILIEYLKLMAGGVRRLSQIYVTFNYSKEESGSVLPLLCSIACYK